MESKSLFNYIDEIYENIISLKTGYVELIPLLK